MAPRLSSPDPRHGCRRHGNDKRLLNRLLRDNVAQIVAFEVNMAGQTHPGGRRQVCVANTHINASVEFADVKLWQTQHLLMEVERMMTQISGSINTLPMVRHRRRLHRHRVVPSSPPPP